MLALERQRHIVRTVEQAGAARVTELARRFGVTEETIRRDLTALEQAGQVTRSHGGVLPARADRAELPHRQRETLNEAAKTLIAGEALQRVAEGDTILLDASSSALFLARLLPDRPMTVVTNAVMVVHALAEHREIRLLCTGGQFAPASMSFTGPLAEKNLREYHVGKLFFSCAGIDLQRGLSDPNDATAQMKQQMLKMADARILLADHSKFNVRALSAVGRLEEVTEIITDDETDAALCGAIRQQGVAVTRVARPGGGPA